MQKYKKYIEALHSKMQAKWDAQANAHFCKKAQCIKCAKYVNMRCNNAQNNCSKCAAYFAAMRAYYASKAYKLFYNKRMRFAFAIAQFAYKICNFCAMGKICSNCKMRNACTKNKAIAQKCLAKQYKYAI
jgi:hypothetical protein